MAGPLKPDFDDIERIDLRSGLPLAYLRDMRLLVDFSPDHEGGGSLTIDYRGVEPGRRLQALVQIMGALSNRLERAIGTEELVKLLVHVADERRMRGH